MSRRVSPLVGPAVLVAAIGAWFLSGATTQAQTGASSPVRVPAGTYLPLYPGPSARGDRRVTVDTFAIDARAVTNAAFLAFLRGHPEWRRSRVAATFADAAYLRHWQDDLVPGDAAPAEAPVVNVSWFAARAYLASVGQRLPTRHEWEYVAASKPRGVQGIPGPLQEWLEDFNSALATGESRADNAVDRSLFCGSGTTGASDLLDYPAFLRHAFRSSLDARYSLSNLGFRGVVRTSPTPRAVAAAATTPVRDASIYAPDVSLMDAHGRWTRLANLRGRLVVATMVYTSCQSVCPMITARLKDIERRLPPALRARVTFALFSLDPGRDTPAALAAFAAAHDLDAERWQLLAASDANVRTLSVLFGVKYAGDRNGSLVHSAVIVVLDPDGIIRHRETGTVADSAAVVAALTRIPR